MSLYAVGITLSTEGGAIVAFEKRPRKTERTREAWYYGVREDEPVYEDVLRLVGAEQLSGGLPERIAHIAQRLRKEPLLDDSTVKVEIGVFGRPVLRLFADAKVHPWPVAIGGEQESTDKNGLQTVPLHILQAIASVALQTNRIEIEQSVIEGPAILAALERVESMPEHGPARDLGIAAAIAVWVAHHHRSGGPWASSKPAPHDADLDWTRRARAQMKERAERASRRSGGDW